MRYRLREELFYCIAGQDVIFLDLPASRYFALPPAKTTIFRQLVARNGEPFPGVDAALSSLISAGYLVKTADHRPTFVNLEIEAPSRDAYSNTQAPFRLWPLLVALGSDLLASLRVRLLPLHLVLKRSGMPRRNSKGDDCERKREIELWISAFNQAGFILGRTNRCLARSIAMFSVLRARGLAADLVIGVRSEPFSAHAWVQHRSTVLNDTIGQINNYSPILVLR